MNNTTKRIIAFIIWLALTVFYVWLCADMFKSMAHDVLDRIDSSVQSYASYDNFCKENDKDISYEEWTAGSFSVNPLDHFGGLEASWKFDGILIGIFNVIYFAVTIGCYHYTIVRYSDN